MNLKEQHFVAVMQDHFQDLSVSPDGETFLIDHVTFELRFSIEHKTFNVHFIKVSEERIGIGGGVIGIVKDFCNDNLIDQIVAIKVHGSAMLFWEAVDFQAAADDDYVFVV